MKKKIFLLFALISIIASFYAMTASAQVDNSTSTARNAFRTGQTAQQISNVANTGSGTISTPRGNVSVTSGNINIPYSAQGGNTPSVTPAGTPDYYALATQVSGGSGASGSGSSGGSGASGGASGGPINYPTLTQSSINSPGQVIVLIAQIGGYLLAAAGALSIVFMIIGGLRYITASGNPAQMEGAKKTVVYALVGVAVVVLSFSLVSIVVTVLTTSSSGGGSAAP